MALDRTLDVAVLDERRVAELDGDVLRNLLVLDEAVLLVVLLALLLLLGLVVGRVSRVALLVVTFNGTYLDLSQIFALLVKLINELTIHECVLFFRRFKI